MAVHQLVYEQFIPAAPAAVWQFFSNPSNLELITPEDMRFRVITRDLPSEIHPGLIIMYKVSPLFRIPLFWMTEITQVVPGRLFVDEQRRGPYRLWHHQHHFLERAGGVLMRDIVHYQLPLGYLGEAARVLFLQKKLEHIFTYRRNKVASVFPGS